MIVGRDRRSGGACMACFSSTSSCKLLVTCVDRAMFFQPPHSATIAGCEKCICGWQRMAVRDKFEHTLSDGSFACQSPGLLVLTEQCHPKRICVRKCKTRVVFKLSDRSLAYQSHGLLVLTFAVLLGTVPPWLRIVRRCVSGSSLCLCICRAH